MGRDAGMSMDAPTLAESALRFSGQELALRSETLRAVAALDLLGAGIVGIDPEGRIEYIDRVASELTGWTLQSARTRPADSLAERICVSDGMPPVGNCALVPSVFLRLQKYSRLRSWVILRCGLGTRKGPWERS